MRHVGTFCVAMLVAAPAAAEAVEHTKQECVAANEAAQDLRSAGKLEEARAELTVCVSDSCPKAVREDCAQRLDEIDKAMRPATASQRGDVGETCTKRIDCKEGLRCHDEKCSAASDEEPDRRRLGFGVGFGGGAAAGTLRAIRTLDDTGVTAEVIFSSFEFSWYLPGEHAINVYVPLVNNVIGWGLVKGFVWNMDAMFTFNVGSGDLRFVAGPGVGFSVLLGQIFQDGPNAAGAGLRIPGEIAVEYLWAKHTWGVKFAARPWIEIATERYDRGPGTLGSTANTTGAGIIGMFVLSRFSTKTGQTP